ncbi:hypothetical protein [Nocardia sp. CC201C]|uniref:hypothetical protein n=1 Tax=Nocardia sp. CC201C TaxID=3044575 RepID=UPI0024A8D514|nr:hypothetical protein [Nocardia sp. CC201C]
MNETLADGGVLMPWKPGPRHDVPGAVFVAVTDFLATSEEDVRQVYEIGVELGRTWPVMQGAVGLWLWGRPAELRGGSISVWESRADMRRFVRWPVHTDIMRTWRGRVGVASESWIADTFDPAAILDRARAVVDAPHRAAV